MKRLTVTIPDELYNELYKLASKDMRTVSNELTYISLPNDFINKPIF